MGFGGNSRKFLAAFPGECPECGCDIAINDEILYVAAHEHEPVHSECEFGTAGVTKKPAALPPTCAECGLMHAGEC